MQTLRFARTRSGRTQLALGVGLRVLNELAGESSILFYSVEILEMAGFAAEGVVAGTVAVMGVVGFAGVLSGLALIDRVGRRRLLMLSCGLTLASLLMLSAAFVLQRQDSPSVVGGAQILELGWGAALCPVPAARCVDCLRAGCGFCDGHGAERVADAVLKL